MIIVLNLALEMALLDHKIQNELPQGTKLFRHFQSIKSAGFCMNAFYPGAVVCYKIKMTIIIASIY